MHVHIRLILIATITISNIEIRIFKCYFRNIDSISDKKCFCEGLVNPKWPTRFSLSLFLLSALESLILSSSLAGFGGFPDSDSFTSPPRTLATAAELSDFRKKKKNEKTKINNNSNSGFLYGAFTRHSLTLKALQHSSMIPGDDFIKS